MPVKPLHRSLWIKRCTGSLRRRLEISGARSRRFSYANVDQFEMDPSLLEAVWAPINDLLVVELSAAQHSAPHYRRQRKMASIHTVGPGAVACRLGQNST
jgi:hypothetical protein